MPKSFSMKDVWEAIYIPKISILRARTKKLFRLFQSMNIDKIKQLNMKESKIGYLSILYRLHFFKDMYLKTQIEMDRMKMISYTLDIRSIMYVMLCTRLGISYALSIASRYQYNLSIGH